MKRRQFFKGAAVAATAGAVGQSAQAQELSWKLVTSLPKGLPGPGVSADRFAARVTQMSGGRLTVTVYGAGELVPPFGTQEAVEGGVAEIYHGSGSWFAGRNIGHNFFSVIPFGADAREFSAWLRHGGGQELWDEMVEPRGLKCFTGGGSGVQSAGWFNKEITSLADLQGLNFRITGLGALVMQKIGVNAISMPPGEIFPALQAGTLDGAEWVGPNNDLAFGFQKIMSHMYAPSFSDIHGGIEFGINLEAWNSLPEDLQQIIQVCAEAETELLMSDGFYGNVLGLKQIKDETDVVVGQFPDDVWDALRAATHEVMAEVRESDELIARIHDSFFGFVEQAVDYRKSYEQELYVQRAKFFS